MSSFLAPVIFNRAGALMGRLLSGHTRFTLAPHFAAALLKGIPGAGAAGAAPGT